MIATEPNRIVSSPLANAQPIVVLRAFTLRAALRPAGASLYGGILPSRAQMFSRVLSGRTAEGGLWANIRIGS